MKQPSVDLVISAYVATRDELEKMKKAFDAQVADLKALQEKRELWLKGQLDALGVSSFKSAHGTCFTAEKTSATVADWQSFLEWVITNDQFDFLEHRVNKTAVVQRLDDGETLPPGTNFTTLKTVQIRRA